MPENITETTLPGVGVRHELRCGGGDRIGVITRHSGRRELVVYDDRDPDRVAANVELSAAEAQLLAELLGGTRISEQLRTVVGQVAGLAIDWLRVPLDFEARAIGQMNMREETGVSVIAVVRSDQPIPAPGPDTVLHPGDTIVVTGTPAGVAAASELLGA